MATCGLGRNSVEPGGGCGCCCGCIGFAIAERFSCGSEFSRDETFAGCQNIAGKESVTTATVAGQYSVKYFLSRARG